MRNACGTLPIINETPKKSFTISTFAAYVMQVRTNFWASADIAFLKWVFFSL